MLHNGSVLDRRQLLLAGAGLPGTLHGLAAPTAGPGGLRLEYDASNPPEVPPPLRIQVPARMVLEFSRIGDVTTCTLALRVALENEQCLLPVALWTADLAYYRRAREALHLPARLGDVGWAAGRWSLEVAGRESYKVRTGEGPAELKEAAPPLPWVTYRHSVEPDWRRGPLGENPAELWMLRPGEDVSTGQLATEGLATSGDLGGWLSRFGASGPVSATAVGPLKEPEPEFGLTVEAADFEPFALRNYPGDSLGMPPLATTFLEPNGLEAYRNRQEIRLSGVMIASIDAAVDRDAVAPLLPPPCRAPDTAVVRVTGVRGLDDPGLDEAWLFAECELEGQRAWYALSHVRARISGSELGREVLGYPTVLGTTGATLGASRFGVSVSRHGAQLYEGGGFYGGFSTGTSLADMRVAALRLRHRPRQSRPAGEIVIQPWYYQGLRKPVSRESLFSSFEAGPASAWSGIGPARAYWAIVFDSATLQRLPGTIVAEVDDVGPYFRDRCDGRLPWEAPTGSRESASD